MVGMGNHPISRIMKKATSIAIAVVLVAGIFLSTDFNMWAMAVPSDGTVDSEQKISDTEGGFGGTLDNGDEFGVSVAGIGDLDDDGTEDIAVGARLDDDGGTDIGAVWILFMSSVAIQVNVDIKPGSDPNCIKSSSGGNIPVAILGNSIGVTTIDVSTIEIDDDDDFATNGVAPVRSSFKDVNADTIADLILHFNTPGLSSAGLLVDGNELFITGELTDGTPIIGSDDIFLAGGPNCLD